MAMSKGRKTHRNEIDSKNLDFAHNRFGPKNIGPQNHNEPIRIYTFCSNQFLQAATAWNQYIRETGTKLSAHPN